jgi:hypothetical protein
MSENKIGQSTITIQGEVSSLIHMKKFKEKYRGKIIYCTPGSGKTTLVENHILFVDSDVLMKETIEERHPEFPFQDGMTIQNYIRDFTNLYKYKTKINNAVLKKAHKLCEDGLTVLTGTIKLSKNADFVFVLKPDNPSIKESQQQNELLLQQVLREALEPRN